MKWTWGAGASTRSSKEVWMRKMEREDRADQTGNPEYFLGMEQGGAGGAGGAVSA